jgi:hypothetical protein
MASSDVMRVQASSPDRGLLHPTRCSTRPACSLLHGSIGAALILAAFCRRSPLSPVQQLSTSFETRISRMGLLVFLSATCSQQRQAAGVVGRQGLVLLPLPTH